MTDLPIEPMTLADLAAVLDDHHRYWGERDLRPLHLRALVHEFADTCLVARAPDGIRGYLVGFCGPAGTGYIHLLAVRDDARGGGLGRRLYRKFTAVATRHGATRLKAITGVDNADSIAFHRALGFDLARIADYYGPGEHRIVFRRTINATGQPDLSTVPV